MKALILLVSAAVSLAGQPVITNVFPPAEFAARRAAVMAQLGDAVAIVLGTTETPGETPLRQNSQFHYLCGVVEPRAILVLDGRTRQTTLFLTARDARRDSSAYGPGLGPGAEAVAATGVDAALDRTSFEGFIRGMADRNFYTPFRAEVLGSVSQGDPDKLWAANRSDPFDGRVSREEAFRSRLREVVPKAEIKDLDPILNGLRAVKSAREIAVIREATRIAGLGIMEAMREARPGLYEYQLQAASEYVFKRYGAFGAAYFALIGAGENTYYTHYHRNTAQLRAGDLVQYDYAPDYRYYQSDVTRVFPANGRFTAWQREYYTIYLKLYRAVLSSVRPGITPAQAIRDAAGKMEQILATFRFSDQKIRRAAEAFAGKYRTSNSLGHTVGMEVHDVPRPAGVLQPGEIFTIEPEMRIEELHLGMRLEDMLLITETGCENLSVFVPIEIADIEKLMADHRHGLGSAHATLPLRH